MSFAQTSFYQLGYPTVKIKKKKKFEQYDVTGFVSSNYNGTYIYFTLPLVTLKENSNYNNWLRNYALPCVYQQFFNAGINVDNARMQDGTTSYQFLQQVGTTCSGDIYCVPLRPIEVKSYDPALSEDEIDGDEVSGYGNSSQMFLIAAIPNTLTTQKLKK